MNGVSFGSKKVSDISIAQEKPSDILAVIQKKFPGDQEVPRQVYNYRSQSCKDAFESCDIVSYFFSASQQHNYYMKRLVDSEINELTYIFMVHPNSINMLWTYYWYICIDSMYKTNMYQYPLFKTIRMTPCNLNFLIAYDLI